MDKNSDLIALKYLASINIDNKVHMNQAAAEHYLSVTSRYSNTIQRVNAPFLDIVELAMAFFGFNNSTTMTYQAALNDETTRRVSTYLTQFSSLTQLCIVNTAGSSFIEHILGTCPALKRLELRRQYRPIYGPTMPYQNFVLIDKKGSDIQTTTAKFKHHNLRTLKIGLENLSDHMRDYIYFHPSILTNSRFYRTRG